MRSRDQGASANAETGSRPAGQANLRCPDAPRIDPARTIAALYVETGGCYFGLPGVDPWDAQRDARLYDGPYPVVAHPPCDRWHQLSAVNHKRWGFKINDDGGHFAFALAAVRKWGGVLEHPAESRAFKFHGIPEPARGWRATMMPRRKDDRYRRIPMDWPTAEELGKTGAVEMLTRDNAKMREAGCNLAEAAGRVVRDYDGLHRLSIAIGTWFNAIAGEGDRDSRHAASVDRSGEAGETGTGSTEGESAGPKGDAQTVQP